MKNTESRKFNFNTEKEFNKFTDTSLVAKCRYNRIEWIGNNMYMVYIGIWMPLTLKADAEFWIKKR